MRNILYIIPQLNIGGAELQLLKLIRGLDKTKYCIHVCSLDKKANRLENEFRQEGIKITEIHKKNKLDIAIVYRINRYIRENRIDIVHSFLNNMWSRLACILLKKRPRVIISERSVDDWWKKWYHFKVDEFLLKYTDLATCNSYEIKNFYEKKLGSKAKGKFKVIYNGIETEEYLRSLENRKQNREKLGIKNNDIVFGIIASLRPIKDHMTLLKATKIIKEKGLKFKLLIIGDGYLKSELQDYVSINYLNEYVAFLGNIIPITNILPVIDIGISTSLREGLSNSIIELGILGKKVIASNIGANKELITDDVNGNLFDVGDEADLAKIMESYIEEKICLNINEKYVVKFREKFDIRKMLDEYEKIYC